MLKQLSLSFKSLYRFSASSAQVSDIVFKFRQDLTLHENESSRFIVPQSELTNLSTKDAINLSGGFLASHTELRLYRVPPIDSKNRTINYPRNSFLQIHLPLGENEDLKNRYIRFKPGLVRVGRLLEALDFTAGFVAYFHSYGEPLSFTCTMMTVCVDHLKFFRQIRGDRNIVINAYPTYVGQSTVEIRTDLLQKEDNAKEETLAASALFLMAARNTQDYSKPFILPKLSFEGENDIEKCVLRSELGKMNQEKRKSMGLNNYFKRPPSQEESLRLHSIFMNMKEKWRHNVDYFFMKETKKSKSILMHIQDRNLHGKIFGGYLMRESIELAWLVAYKYAKFDHPEFEAIDDFTFHEPVEIGTIVELDATVTYSEAQFMNITVEAIKVKCVEGEEKWERKKCTELHMTFRCPETAIIKPVYPATYGEAMKFLYSKRKMERL